MSLKPSPKKKFSARNLVSGCALICALPIAVHAQVTWDGSESNDGNDPLNWDTGSRPTFDDTIVIDALGTTITPFQRSDAATNFTGTLDLRAGTLQGNVGGTTNNGQFDNNATLNIGDGSGAAQSAVYEVTGFPSGNGNVQRRNGTVTINVAADGYLDVSGAFNRGGGSATLTTVDGGRLTVDGGAVIAESDVFTVRNGGTVIFGNADADETLARSGTMKIESNSNVTFNELLKDNTSALVLEIEGGGSTITADAIGSDATADTGGVFRFSLDTNGLSTVNVLEDFTATGDFQISRFTTGWAVDLTAVGSLGEYTDTDPLVLFDFQDAGVDASDLTSLAGSLLWSDDGTVGGTTLADGSTVTLGSNEFTLNYIADITNGGSEITLTLIPEPSTLAYLIGLGFLVFGSRRFSRHR